MLTKPELDQLQLPPTTHENDLVVHDGHKLDTSTTVPVSKITGGYFDVDNNQLLLSLSDGRFIGIDGFLAERDLPDVAKGMIGSSGRQGNKGKLGKSGIRGIAGPQGTIGSKGNMGPTGPIGNMGPTGPEGWVGAVGPQGPAGPAGAYGNSGDVNIVISYVDPGTSLGAGSLWVLPNGSFPQTGGSESGCTVYSIPCWVERMNSCPSVPTTTTTTTTSAPATTTTTAAPTTTPTPHPWACRVHFTGILFIGSKTGLWAGASSTWTLPWVTDTYSELVNEGEFTSNQAAFPNAVLYTFDGILIGPETHLTIWSQQNYQGTILLDVDGPLVVNNGSWQNHDSYKDCYQDQYWPGDLGAIFTPDKRIWSTEDMGPWSFGSCKIEC